MTPEEIVSEFTEDQFIAADLVIKAVLPYQILAYWPKEYLSFIDAGLLEDNHIQVKMTELGRSVFWVAYDVISVRRRLLGA